MCVNNKTIRLPRWKDGEQLEEGVQGADRNNYGKG